MGKGRGSEAIDHRSITLDASTGKAWKQCGRYLAGGVTSGVESDLILVSLETPPLSLSLLPCHPPQSLKLNPTTPFLLP